MVKGFSFFGKAKGLLDSANEFISVSHRPRREENSIIGHANMESWLLPPHPLTYTDMIHLSDMQVNVRNCKKHAKWETFRRGMVWTPNWTAYCKHCDVKYPSINARLPCPECGGEMEPPNPKEYEKADEFFKNCNLNNQNLQQVLEGIEDDQNTCDEGYILLRKQYVYDQKGEIVSGKIKEIVRVSPTIMRPVANPKTGSLSHRMWICPEHRDINQVMVVEYDVDDMSDIGINRPVCEICHRPAYPVMYVGLRIEGGSPETYYIDGEILNAHKYGSGILYGTPPMLTLWTIASALFYQETYIRDYYQERRTPLGAIVVNTSNAPNFLRFWKKVMDELRADKFFIPFVPLETEPGSTQQGRINWVSFMDKLTEMEYVPSRDEFRRAISAFYGVSTTFMNEQITAGQGNISEGIHLVVSARTIERTQNLYNEVYLPKICGMMGVENWVLKLKPTEERDELKRLQQEQLQMQNCQIYESIGYKSEKDEYTGEWYHQKDVNRELMEATQVLDMLTQLTMPVPDPMGMDQQEGQPQDGGKMQSFEPNPVAANKGYDDEQEDVSLMKSKLEGTPSQNTTSMSQPRTIDRNPSGNKLSADGKNQGVPNSTRTKPAPGTEGDYVCSHCGKRFPTKQALGGHVKDVHGGGGKNTSAQGVDPNIMGKPTPRMYLKTLQIMRQSQMFDKNILNLIQQQLGMESPTEANIEVPQPSLAPPSPSVGDIQEHIGRTLGSKKEKG